MAERRQATDGLYGGICHGWQGTAEAKDGQERWHPKVLNRLGFSGIDEEHHITVDTTRPILFDTLSRLLIPRNAP